MVSTFKQVSLIASWMQPMKSTNGSTYNFFVAMHSQIFPTYAIDSLGWMKQQLDKKKFLHM
jgi:hypothetical protein